MKRTPENLGCCIKISKKLPNIYFSIMILCPRKMSVIKEPWSQTDIFLGHPAPVCSRLHILTMLFDKI